jgi:hypothetical protein
MKMEDIEITEEEMELLTAPVFLKGEDAFRAMAIERVEKEWEKITSQFEDSRLAEELHHNTDLHKAIWEASTVILPKLEVQVVIDAENKIFVSTGSAGYVDFSINPIRKGMKVPVKCWIHTHPFGSAYFSGTDIRTVRTWEPLMETAYVLGGEEHYGFWSNEKPNQLDIFVDNDFARTQEWKKLGEEE